MLYGTKANISMDRAFGCLTYFALEHEFNDTSSSLAKPHDRSHRGLHVGHGRDGSIRDRRQPGYYNYAVGYNQSRPVVTPHTRHLEFEFPTTAGLEWPKNFSGPPTSPEPTSAATQPSGRGGEGSALGIRNPAKVVSLPRETSPGPRDVGVWAREIVGEGQAAGEACQERTTHGERSTHTPP